MITITLRLSESLLCILRDADTPMNETIQCETESGTSVAELLFSQKINPLLVPMIALDTKAGIKKIDKRTIIETDSVLILYGPLAGG